MLDLGISKLAVLGVLALIVVGPEKLPRVARMAGTFLGKAQRYVNDVKAEVNRSIELEELRKMQAQVQQEASSISQSLSTTAEEMRKAFHAGDGADAADGTPPQYRHPGKNWRLRRSATPQWYKQQTGTRRYVQSGSARVARFRPQNYS